MKKIFTIVASIFLLFNFTNLTLAKEDIVAIAKKQYHNIEEKYKPQAALLFDINSGEILFNYNSDKILPPASLTKLMTTYIVYENIDKGNATLETTVKADSRYEHMSKIPGLATSKIIAGEQYTIKELLAMNLIASSNVATIMLAEHFSNNDYDNFITTMNNTANQLNMKNTKFNNVSGAENNLFHNLLTSTLYKNDEPNETTTKDLAILTKELITKHPAILEVTKNSSIILKQGQLDEQKLENTNYSLTDGKIPFSEVDGLKTGSSPKANFNIIVTAKKDNRRLAAIVLGAGDWNNQESKKYRNIFANSLLAYGFNNFKKEVVLPAGRHKIQNTELITTTDLIVTTPINRDIEDYMFTLNKEHISWTSQFKTTNNIPISVNYEKVSLKTKIVEFISNALKNKNKKLIIVIFLLTTFFLYIVCKLLFRKKEI